MAKQKDQSSLPAVDRFLALFAGNTRSSGRFDPVKERLFTEYSPIKADEVKMHLEGKMGIGIVPIQDDDTCVWAAIDLDNHDSDEDLPIVEVSEKIVAHKLPLVACRSRSGGIHCYLFLDKPQPCTKVRIFMNGWAALLGYPGSEVFPKQGRLVATKDKDGPKPFGNWLNMPYFHVKDCGRYAVVNGERLTFAQFLDHAEKSRVSESGLRALSMVEHPDAPPCVQKMFSNGVAQGHRNEALYNVVVYYKKAVPDGFEAKATEANASIFTKPLPRAEMLRTINSAGRADCAYRCNEEPMRSLCDRDTCITRKFGISSGDLERLNTVDALPTFSDLTKYLTEPVRWEFKIDGVSIGNVATGQLLDWRVMREIIAERLTKIVPMIKGQEWERILNPLMQTARIVEAPDDASVSGVIRDRLREFASKTDLGSRGEDKTERKALLRGLPVVQIAEGERCVVFRGQDFINFLKRTKSEELKGVNLWFAVKNIGVFHARMRITNGKDNENINVWAIPVKEVMKNYDHLSTPPEFRSDL